MDPADHLYRFMTMMVREVSRRSEMARRALRAPRKTKTTEVTTDLVLGRLWWVEELSSGILAEHVL